ncbi:MAG TPA: hypothetical protein VG713_18975 [Pirellulales bacterium]|nr:hypothetical protein [Pirellulales bacterium]
MSCCTTYAGTLPQPLRMILLGSGGVSPACSPDTFEEAMVAYLLGNPGLACTIDDRLYPHQVSRANKTWPAITYYVEDAEHEIDLQGHGGFAWTTISFDCWSSKYLEAVRAAKALRQALQGFIGQWGNFAIGAVIPDGGDEDDVQEPADGSGVCWYSRSLGFRVLHGESAPQF